MIKNPFRLAWATDLHLPKFGPDAGDKFIEYVDLFKKENPDAILLTGDIADATSIYRYLEMFAYSFLGINIYFVLGNHDYHGAYFEEIRRKIRLLTSKYKNLIYLHESEYAYELTPTFCLVGVDGWGDGRLGMGEGTKAQMSDWDSILDFSNYGQNSQKWKLVHNLGDGHSKQLDVQLRHATTWFKNILVATHVPPWESVCEYEGNIATPDQIPHYTCAAVGKVIDDYHQGSCGEFIVCCGHTHSAVDRLIKPRLQVYVGGMGVRTVEIQKTILLPRE